MATATVANVGILTLPETAGNEWFSASGVCAEIDREFAALGLDVPSKATGECEIEALPLPNRRHTHLFRLFREADALTQAQAVEACRMLRDAEADAVLVPFYCEGDFYAAEMRAGEVIYLHEWDYKFSCNAGKRETLAVRRK